MPSLKLTASQAKSIYLYKNLRAKVQRCCCNIYFNGQCLKQGLIPQVQSKQNYRYWAPETPQELHQRSLHGERLVVCLIASFGLLGPYFFEDNEGAAVNVTSERYVAMLRNFCEPGLRRRWIDPSSLWFQQDGATAHTARASMNVLRKMFLHKYVISRGGDVPWPARSPDLSAYDYFLWGYLKSRVFISKPRTIAETKASIKEEIVTIPEHGTRRLMENLGVRLKQCLRNGGRHLSDVLFKT